MRIALYIPSLRGGGAEKVWLRLAQGLIEIGLEVDLVLARATGPYLPHVPSGVRLVDLASSRVLCSLPGLTRYLRRVRPIAVLSALSHANVVALWARALARVPTRVLVSVHTTASVAARRAPSRVGRLMPFFMSRFYPWADAIVAVSQGVADDLAEHIGIPKAKIHVIYNPIVTPELFRLAEEPLEHPWFCDGKLPVVLGVGRLTAEKDFQSLIRAFAQVRENHPCRLMILGEGEERPFLEKLVRELGIENEVRLPGFTYNPYQYMKRAAVFVLCSRREGLPTALVEAIALGCPVVATDCPHGPAEVLKGHESLLVPIGDVTAMARAILNALQEQAQPRVDLHRYSIDYAVSRYASLLGIPT